MKYLDSIQSRQLLIDSFAAQTTSNQEVMDYLWYELIVDSRTRGRNKDELMTLDHIEIADELLRDISRIDTSDAEMAKIRLLNIMQHVTYHLNQAIMCLASERYIEGADDEEIIYYCQKRVEIYLNAFFPDFSLSTKTNLNIISEYIIAHSLTREVVDLSNSQQMLKLIKSKQKPINEIASKITLQDKNEWRQSGVIHKDSDKLEIQEHIQIIDEFLNDISKIDLSNKEAAQQSFLLIMKHIANHLNQAIVDLPRESMVQPIDLLDDEIYAINSDEINIDDIYHCQRRVEIYLHAFESSITSSQNLKAAALSENRNKKTLNLSNIKQLYDIKYNKHHQKENTSNFTSIIQEFLKDASREEEIDFLAHCEFLPEELKLQAINLVLSKISSEPYGKNSYLAYILRTCIKNAGNVNEDQTVEKNFATKCQKYGITVPEHLEDFREQNQEKIQKTDPHSQ